MSRFEFKLPDIGEGVAEGEIVAWHVKAGDSVREDQPMVEVMTDKATVTIGAPKNGNVAEIRFQIGQVARVGDVLIVLNTDAPSSSVESHPPPPSGGGVKASAVGDIREALPGASFFSRSSTPQTSSGGGSGSTGNGYFHPKPLATPATRKLARDTGIDLRNVPPTGKKNRVTNDDVKNYSAAHGRGAVAEDRPALSASVHTATELVPKARAAIVIRGANQEQQSLEERKPFIGMRRKIAERMQLSKNTAAHFTFVEECEVSRLMEIRARLEPTAMEQGVKLTFLPFVVKAVIAALKKHPILNSALDESSNELVFRNYYNIGIATATDQGLVVPTVHRAERLSLIDLAREISRLAEGARKGTLTISELSGSTFTVTSLGKLGGLMATPVLNFPEVGILGIHRIKERPVVKNGKIEIGQVMLLSLSFDHRIVDGHVGAAFAYDVIGMLEEPNRMLLELS